MVKKVEHHQSSKCPIACSLDIIGDHWTLLVIRELMLLGHHQYKDFLSMPEGISSNILTDRLKRLEASDIIRHIYKRGSKKDKLYYLSKKGKGLVYVMIEIVRWADLNIQDRISIPADERAFLDKPIQQVAKNILSSLESWEKENLN